MEGSASGLLAEGDDCGHRLLRLLGRGHAVAAELEQVADEIPPALAGKGPNFQRLQRVLPTFEVFRTEGAVGRVASTPELIELDEESRELHIGPAKRMFHLFAAIRKYAADLNSYFRDLEEGLFVSHTLETVVRDPDGVQFVPEAVALLGTLLLLLDERLPGLLRERALVVFYRFTVGTNDENDAFPEVCQQFKETDRPAEAEQVAKRKPGYPESFFSRFPLPAHAIRLVLGQLQTGDVYNAASHYPLPEHRSHSLAAQAGLLYVILFFQPDTLHRDVVAMREIVNRFFADSWVVAYALGSSADLLAMWAPYKAAREALGAAITADSVRHVHEHHTQRLAETRRELDAYLKEGALTEDLVMQKTSSLLNCLRQANTTIRWLLLQSTTTDSKLQPILSSSDESKEQLMQALIDTALLEDRVRALMAPLVARRGADMAKLQAKAAQSINQLAVYFSGEHVLGQGVKNESLESWFRDLHHRIEDLKYGTQSEALELGRSVSRLCRAIEDIEQNYHEVSQQLQIVHFLGEARGLLQRMVRTVNLSEGTLATVAVVGDLSYAWKRLGAYQPTMQKLLAKSTTGSVKGLRALFLKLATILEVPMRRIRQAGKFAQGDSMARVNEAHATIVSNYYSSRFVLFLKAVLQEIPRLIFQALALISKQTGTALPPGSWTARVSLAELQQYASMSEGARNEVSLQAEKIALLMRGIREADVAFLGAILVEPRVVLVEGLREELARNIEAFLASLSFSKDEEPVKREKTRVSIFAGSTEAAEGPPQPVRADFLRPMEALAGKVESLRRAFEYIQDYVGVSALQMWHSELGRVVSFLSFMELHTLLRKRGRPPQPTLSPHHDPDRPIAFPDSGQSSMGSSFISRTAAQLLALTNPQIVGGGLRGEWRNAQTGTLILDDLAFEVMHRAIGAPGVAELSQYMGLKACHLVRQLCNQLLTLLNETTNTWTKLANQVRDGVDSGSEAVQKLKAAGQDLLAKGHAKPLLEAVATVGQHQMLRCRLAYTLRLHARIEAPLVSESLLALDRAGLPQAVEQADSTDPGNSLLPSIWDFVGDSGLADFHRDVARSAQLVGLGDPLRQIYVMVPEGSVPTGMDALLASLLLLPQITIGKASDKTAKRKSTVSGKKAEGSPALGRAEMECALLAGAATLLQQLPRSQTEGLLELLGLFICGTCTESAAAGEGPSVADGAQVTDFAHRLLGLLKLPREMLAEFAPQGLLDLWPPE